MHKAILNKYVNIYIPKIIRGRKMKVPIWKILNAIFYKIKTGVQWHLLPLKEFFGNLSISYQSVYYHYNKWCKIGIFHKVYNHLLKEYKHLLDCSILNFDGSHSPTKRGGEKVGYQGRKKSKTTNMLILSDKTGIPLAISPGISGDHHDLYKIEIFTREILEYTSQILGNLEGLFLNADAGFDSKKFIQLLNEYSIFPNVDKNKRNTKKQDLLDYVFDDELYKFRFSVEQTNAWIDNYKSLIIRCMTSSKNWEQSHYISFISMFLRNRIMVNFNF